MFTMTLQELDSWIYHWLETSNFEQLQQRNLKIKATNKRISVIRYFSSLKNSFLYQTLRINPLYRSESGGEFGGKGTPAAQALVLDFLCRIFYIFNVVQNHIRTKNGDVLEVAVTWQWHECKNLTPPSPPGSEQTTSVTHLVSTSLVGKYPKFAAKLVSLRQKTKNWR